MIDHLADLRSDFSRFHRVDDIESLHGPQFMEMAWRISAYRGVMHMRLQEQEQRSTPQNVPSRTPSSPRTVPAVTNRGGSDGGAKVVPLGAFMASFPGAVERRRSRREGDR